VEQAEYLSCHHNYLEQFQIKLRHFIRYAPGMTIYLEFLVRKNDKGDEKGYE